MSGCFKQLEHHFNRPLPSLTLPFVCRTFGAWYRIARSFGLFTLKVNVYVYIIIVLFVFCCNEKNKYIYNITLTQMCLGATTSKSGSFG